MSTPPIPPDDPARTLAVVHPDDEGAEHLSVAGGTYTVLLSGADTGGLYALIDMLVPPGAGPPLHRHDYEEMFHLLEGAVSFTFRGETIVVRAGQTVNVPANAPHAFKNTSDAPARMLSVVTPPGEEELFRAIGDPIASRTAPPPFLSAAEKAERGQRARKIASHYRTEMLG